VLGAALRDEISSLGALLGEVQGELAGLEARVAALGG
jgi:hypothetical protein